MATTATTAGVEMERGPRHGAAVFIPEWGKPLVAMRLVRRLTTWGDGCWEQRSGQTSSRGYGCVVLNGERYTAHRAAYALVNGPIPAGMCVCHRCDNPRCIRPSHLFLGTQRENMRDREAKGRSGDRRPPRLLGSASGQARLTESQVRHILDLYASTTLSARAIARMVGGVVSPQAILLIVTGKTWPHVPRPIVVHPDRGRLGAATLAERFMSALGGARRRILREAAECGLRAEIRSDADGKTGHYIAVEDVPVAIHRVSAPLWLSGRARAASTDHPGYWKVHAAPNGMNIYALPDGRLGFVPMPGRVTIYLRPDRINAAWPTADEWADIRARLDDADEQQESA